MEKSIVVAIARCIFITITFVVDKYGTAQI